jgi:hypothetical protein
MERRCLGWDRNVHNVNDMSLSMSIRTLSMDRVPLALSETLGRSKYLYLSGE